MSWTRIDDRLLTHVKMRRARARIGDAALALWTASLVFTNQHELDGLIYGDMLSDFTSHGDPPSVANVLVDVVLWVRDGENYRIHDYLSYNESKAQREQKRTDERQRKAEAIAKKRNGKKAGAAGKTGGNPTPSPPPSPPSESSARKPAGKDAAPTGFQPTSDPELNPLTNPNQPTTTTSTSSGGCRLETTSGPPVRVSEDPLARAILARLLTHPSLTAIATVGHAELIAGAAHAAGRGEQLALQGVDEFAVEAQAKNLGNEPMSVSHMGKGASVYVANVRAKRPDPPVHGQSLTPAQVLAEQARQRVQQGSAGPPRRVVREGAPDGSS